MAGRRPDGLSDLSRRDRLVRRMDESPVSILKLRWLRRRCSFHGNEETECRESRAGRDGGRGGWVIAGPGRGVCLGKMNRGGRKSGDGQRPGSFATGLIICSDSEGAGV